MVAGAIDWNICPEVLGMTNGQMFHGHDLNIFIHIL
jgi:hypothetical protein